MLQMIVSRERQVDKDRGVRQLKYKGDNHRTDTGSAIPHPS